MPAPPPSPPPPPRDDEPRDVVAAGFPSAPLGVMSGEPVEEGIFEGPPADIQVGEARTARAPRGAIRRLGWPFWISVGWVGLVILVAVLANVLPLDDPNAIGSALPKQNPSLQHLLGTDELGRDLFSRVIFGARISLIVGFSSIFIGMAVGGTLGLMAGFFRGPLDTLFDGASTVALAFPALVFLLAIVAVFGQSLFTVVVSIGVISIAPLFRVVRANTIVYAQREFVLAARALGARNARIIAREILPNVLPTALSFALVAVAVAIVAEGALAFLGLSVRPPTPTWGGMISEGRTSLEQDALICLWPSLALFFTVLALNFAGDRLRSFFEVREGGL
jgi:peptide/nickel transport system permease protein